MNSSTVKRLTTLPASPYVPITPARLLGFMDRLKLIHATPPGPELAGLAQAMDVEVALSRAELDARPRPPRMRRRIWSESPASSREE